MRYVAEATVQAVPLLAQKGLKVTLRPSKEQGNLEMIRPPRACKFEPLPLPQDPLTGTSATCCQCGPQPPAKPWPILWLLVRHHHAPIAHATPEQHRWLHTHFEPAPADILPTVTWGPDATAEWQIHRGTLHTKHGTITYLVIAR